MESLYCKNAKHYKQSHDHELRNHKWRLSGWKAKGYPVERYEKSFHLETRN